MTILQLVVLDVEPKGLHDVGSRLSVHAQQTSQPRIQFVLRGLGRRGKKKELEQRQRLWKKVKQVTPSRRTTGTCEKVTEQMHLVVDHEQEGALNIHVAGPFHLETIRLLSSGHSVPLKDKSLQRFE